MALHLRPLHLLLRLHFRERDLLRRSDAHDELHVRRQELSDRLVEPLVGDRRGLPVSLLEQVLLHRSPAIPCANGGTRRIRTSASGAQASPATPSSSIQGMSSGRTPSV